MIAIINIVVVTEKFERIPTFKNVFDTLENQIITIEQTHLKTI